MSEIIAYRNRNDGATYAFDEIQPDLEARDNFERVTDITKVPQAALNALARARAERASIEAAALTVAQRVEAASTETARAAGAMATSHPSPTAVMTGSHLAPVGTNPAEGVLARGRLEPAMTREELEEKAARDSEQLAYHGVLKRPGSELEAPALERTPQGIGALATTPAAGRSLRGPAVVDTEPPATPEPESEGEKVPEAPQGGEPPKRPAKSASKADWVAYAQEVERLRGDERELTDEEIEAQTMAQLQDKYGA